MPKKKLVELEPGDVYAIPLFAAEKGALERFTKKDLTGPDKRFVFMRVIEDRRGAGYIVEVLDVVGGLDTTLADIVRAKRLFRPVATSGLGVHKKRWPLIGRQERYDKERDSGYSAIELVLSAFDEPRLWRGGSESPIPLEDAPTYEEWKLWRSDKLEKRILDALERGEAK